MSGSGPTVFAMCRTIADAKVAFVETPIGGFAITRAFRIPGSGTISVPVPVALPQVAAKGLLLTFFGISKFIAACPMTQNGTSEPSIAPSSQSLR